jgi:hypothetical protein
MLTCTRLRSHNTFCYSYKADQYCNPYQNIHQNIDSNKICVGWKENTLDTFKLKIIIIIIYELRLFLTIMMIDNAICNTQKKNHRIW